MDGALGHEPGELVAEHCCALGERNPVLFRAFDRAISSSHSDSSCSMRRLDDGGDAQDEESPSPAAYLRGLTSRNHADLGSPRP